MDISNTCAIWMCLPLQSLDALAAALQHGFVKIYVVLLLVSGVVGWWLVLTHKSRKGGTGRVESANAFCWCRKLSPTA